MFKLSVSGPKPNRHW